MAGSWSDQHGVPQGRILWGLDRPLLYLISVARATNGDSRLPRPVTPETSNQQDADAGERPAAWMTPAFIDAIARRVMELGSGSTLSARAGESALLTVAEVAARLNVSHAWVYAHKHELGAIRLGNGPKARLRFEATAVLAELHRRDRPADSAASEPTETSKRTRRRLVSRPLPRASRAA